MTDYHKEKEANHPWLVRLAILAVVVVLAVVVRIQIANSEFQIDTEIQSVKLIEDQPLEEIELEQPEFIEEQIEEIVEPEAEEFDEAAEDAPPSLDDMLGLDSAAMAGSDAFGLMARRGGRDILESGDGSLACEWYESVLNTELNNYLIPLLAKHESLLRSGYSVILRLWLEPDGSVERFIVSSTGDEDLDRDLHLALADFKEVGTPPPPDLPQPVRIGLSCRI